MSQGAQNIPISGRKGQNQGAPIPINSANIPRMNIQDTGKDGQAHDVNMGSDFSGSHLGMSGIEAPPNSLATPSLMSSHMGPAGASAAQMLGGWNPPPNTPAQVNRLQQVMGGNNASGSSHGLEPNSHLGYDMGQVPTGSFIDRKIHGASNFREADEDAMDHDMNDRISPNASNSSSFQQPHHHMRNFSSKDADDDVFEME